MDQKRLLIAIAVSIAILLGFQYLMPRAPHPAPMHTVATSTADHPANPDAPAQPGTPAPATSGPGVLAKDAPRLTITAPRVSGTMSLRGAMLDDLVLRDYHEELSDASPLVRVLAPQFDKQPNYIQFGWTSSTPGVKLPDETTDWTPSAKELTPAQPVTLSWNNGAGLTFSIKLAIDDNFMFTAEQSVHNATNAPVVVTPYARVRRDYEPVTSGYYILHEGPVGVLDGTLKDPKYATVKSDGEKHGGLADSYTGPGGWAGITDKYWLTALIPDQQTEQVAAFRYGTAPSNVPRYEVDFSKAQAQTVAPGEQATSTMRAFVGAKEVHLLDRYEREFNIPHFDKAVDFGMFYFLTKPIFFALDWLYGVLGNFGLAIIVFTVFVKALFFPLASRSYRSMSKMKLLGPKMTALRERYKDEPQKLQSEMMALYKAEKVNPASGCLPMVVQIPVFFALYKVIFVTIEMRHAPFFGWVRDLSALDPTNLFNLFGLLPFNPIALSPMLHLSAWTLIMGFTMFMQQQLNPPPPDPTQAKLFKFMPLIFMFMMGRFPAGLLIYWSWNNTLTIGQQWLIMRRVKTAPTSTPALARSAKSRS